MRASLLLALLALAIPATAQTQFADSTGGYVSLRQLGAGDGPVLGVFDATLGYRFSNGTDVGLRVGRPAYASGLTAGPTAGRTWSGPAGSRLRVEGSALYRSRSRTFYFDPASGAEAIERRDLSGDLVATASRSLRLLGSLRVAPTLGVFGVAEQTLTYEGPARFARPAATRAATGLHVEVPLSFRLFGTTATVSAAGRFALLHTGDPYGVDADLLGTYAGGGLRLNF